MASLLICAFQFLGCLVWVLNVAESDGFAQEPSPGFVRADVPCHGPLSVEAISDLIKNGVTVPRQRQWIAVCGLGFPSTDEIVEQLRVAGVTGAILELIGSEDVQKRAELAFWTSVKDRNDPKLLQEYLRRYANGDFAPQATSLLRPWRIEELRIVVPAKILEQKWTEAFPLAAELVGISPSDKQAQRWKELIAARLAAAEKHVERRKDLDKVGFDFAEIPAGTFLMGSKSGQVSERPPHTVQITKAFEISTTEVTQQQWTWLMETNPSQFRGEKRPVDSVTLYEAEQFIHRLNLRNDGYIYRLPTEAEWEYAARAGSLGEYTGKLDAVAWYKSNSGGSSHEVAQKEPNAYGLFDVHGNVWEWCADRYKESYYSESPSSDPKGPSDGLDRVLRGGSWFYAERFQRLSVRWKLPPSVRNANVGFRVLRQEPD